MKVFVKNTIEYDYECEIPDYLIDDFDIAAAADKEDPVYRELCAVLAKAKINFYGDVLSVVNDETGEVLFSGS